MKATLKFVRRITLRARVQAFLSFLTLYLLFAFGLGISASVLTLIAPNLLNASYVVWGSIGLALLVAAVGASIQRIEPIKVLNIVDSRLRLKARLITAYDLHRKGSENPFRDIIETEAEEIAAEYPVKNAYPISTPKGSRLLPAFLVILTMVYLLSLIDVGRRPDTDAVQAGQLLESVGKTLAVRSEDESLSESRRIAEEMQKLGRMLQQQSLSRSETQRRLAELTSKIQEQIEGISRDRLPESSESTAQGENSQGQGAPADSTGGKEPSTDTIRQLRENLAKMGHLTDEETRFLEQLEERLENPQSAESIDSETSSRLESLLNRERRGRELSNLESAGQAVREAGGSLRRDAEGLAEEESVSGEDAGAASSGDSRSPEEGEPSSGPAEPGGTKDPDASSGESDGGRAASGTPGSEAVEDRMGDDFERSGEDTASLMGELDGEITNDSRSLQAVVRNLPEESASLLATEALVVEYSRAVEEAIMQEEIPIAMRNYIKDYFMQIGIKTTDDEE